MKYLLLLPLLLLLACGDVTIEETPIATVIEASASPPVVPVPEPDAIPTLPQTDCPKGISVSADKMNVLYTGIENPVTINITGYDKRRLSVTASNAVVRGSGTQYVVKPTQIGEVVITVRNPLEGELGRFSFRAKRIPDPELKLAGRSSADITAAEFIGAQSVYAVIEGLDIKAACSVVGFQLRRIPFKGPGEVRINRGGAFTEEALAVVKTAAPGDTYLIEKAKLRCPGDQVARVTNALVFNIK